MSELFNTVIAQAAEAFARLGYEACSIDDLLLATGLQRGSLYKAFGSKRNIFEQVLTAALGAGFETRGQDLDLLITALKELASEDQPIAALCREAIATLGESAAQVLGIRLLDNLKKRKTNANHRTNQRRIDCAAEPT